jgi:hypothetical protein
MHFSKKLPTEVLAIETIKAFAEKWDAIGSVAAIANDGQ